MVFAALYREKQREKAREEGREEGRVEGQDETNAVWRDWNERRLAAEANGETFTEPPPDFGNCSGGTGG